MNDSTTATVHGLGEMLALVPYGLGFEPGRSVVAVLMRHGIWKGSFRVPAPAAMGGWREVPAETWAAAARGLRLGWVRDEPIRAGLERGGDGVLLVAYELGVEQAWVGLSLYDYVCSSVGVPVLDTVVVRGGRWCRAGAESLDRWEAVPAASSVGAVSEFVARGVSPLPDRDLLDAAYACDPLRSEPVAAALATIGAGERPILVDQGLRAVAEWVRSPGVGAAEQGPELTAQGLLLLSDPLWRDAMYHRVAPHLAALRPSTTLEAHARRRAPQMPEDASMLLVQVAQLAPTGHRAHLLALIALAEWTKGGGPRASAAARAALLDAPGHAMGRYILTCLEHGLAADPAQWPRQHIA